MKNITFGLLLSLLLIGCTNKSQENSDKPDISLNAGEGIVTGSGEFGSMGPNDSKILSFRIINTGDAPLVGPAQLDNNNFSIIYQSGCASIAPGKRCDLKVSFSASKKSYDYYSARLNLDSVFIDLSATVVNPNPSPVYAVSFLPTSPLNFGTITDKQSAIKSVVITNTGTTTIQNEVVTLGPQYSLISDGCSNKIIPRNRSCTVRVSLNGAGKSGPINELLSFAGGQNIQVNAVVVSSSGTSDLGSPNVQFLVDNTISSSADFGTLSGTQSKQIIVVAKNNGNKASDISPSQLLSNSNFSIAFNQCHNRSLAPGASCQIRVIFSASGKAASSYTDTLTYAGQSLLLSSTVTVPNYNLILNLAGVGTGGVTISNSTFATFYQSSTVSLPGNQSYSLAIAPPTNGYALVTGAICLIQNDCSLLLNNNRTVNVTFYCNQGFTEQGGSCIAQNQSSGLRQVSFPQGKPYISGFYYGIYLGEKNGHLIHLHSDENSNRQIFRTNLNTAVSTPIATMSGAGNIYNMHTLVENDYYSYSSAGNKILGQNPSDNRIFFMQEDYDNGYKNVVIKQLDVVTGNLSDFSDNLLQVLEPNENLRNQYIFYTDYVQMNDYWMILPYYRGTDDKFFLAYIGNNIPGYQGVIQNFFLMDEVNGNPIQNHLLRVGNFLVAKKMTNDYYGCNIKVIDLDFPTEVYEYALSTPDGVYPSTLSEEIRREECQSIKMAEFGDGHAYIYIDYNEIDRDTFVPPNSYEITNSFRIKLIKFHVASKTITNFVYPSEQWITSGSTLHKSSTGDLYLTKIYEPQSNQESILKINSDFTVNDPQDLFYVGTEFPLIFHLSSDVFIGLKNSNEPFGHMMYFDSSSDFLGGYSLIDNTIVPTDYLEMLFLVNNHPVFTAYDTNGNIKLYKYDLGLRSEIVEDNFIKTISPSSNIICSGRCENLIILEGADTPEESDDKMYLYKP